MDCNSTVNASSAQVRYITFHPVFHTLLIFLCFAVTFLNIFVIYLYAAWIRTRLASTFLLLNLALTDLVSGAVTIPMVILSSTRALPGKRARFLLSVTASTVSVFTVYTSIFALSAIAFDRYVLVCKPLQYRRWVTTRKIKVIIAILWILALILAVVPFTWSHEILWRQVTIEGFRKIHEIDSVYSIFCSVIFFFLPLAFIAFALVHMMIAVRRDSKLQSGGSDTGKFKEMLERRAAVLFAAMFCMFVISWTPFMTIRLLADMQYSFGTLPEYVPQLLVVMRYLMSIINPVLYSLRTRNFRCAITACFVSKMETISRKYNICRRQSYTTVVESVAAKCDGKRQLKSLTEGSPWPYFLDDNTNTVAL